MPRTLYKTIYDDLKIQIEEGNYAPQTLLPSEKKLIEIYNCSRNTVRRAINDLAQEGYVQSVHGKGVFVIYHPIHQAMFAMGGIESFKESAIRNKLHARTRVAAFAEITCDKRVSKRTGFPVGEPLYYIQRVRYLDNIPSILDINLFSRKSVPGLTFEIAENSIYEYIEKKLGLTIVTSKRIMTVEKATEIDEKYLNLNLDDYNCLAVVTSQIYGSDGTMFEYTQSRHLPKYFCFMTTATRKI